MGSAIKRVSSRGGGADSQLDDFSKFEYNKEFEMWMPAGVDPKEYAAANGAEPPPPPTSSAAPSEPAAAGGAAGSTPMRAPGEQATDSMRTPQPAGMPGAPIPSGSGPARFSARSGSARRSAVRGRYVDTFNPDGGADDDKSAMPPPPAREPKKAPPMNVFVPKAAPQTPQTPTNEGDVGNGGAE